MAATGEEHRFQVLPSSEKWEELKGYLDNKGYKLIIIDETFWYNKLTRCKGKVTHMPIMALHDNSDRPIAITKMQIQTSKTEEELRTEECFSLKAWDTTSNSQNNIRYRRNTREEYVFNMDYSHQNINSSYNWHNVELEWEEQILSDGCKIKYPTKVLAIQYYSICSPITQHHFYSKDLEELKLIFKGQLMGQNGGSPFRTVDSVANNYKDLRIQDSGGAFIKRTAPIIQLISRYSLASLRSSSNLAETIRTIRLPKNDDEVMIKLIKYDHYVLATKEEAKVHEANNELSAYYPTITYEQCADILASLPKIEVDFACFGLGSAGTGILDQIGRSTWFEKYLLCDMDAVEPKNLRNQWYTTRHLHLPKASASKEVLKTLNPTTREILEQTCKFQEVRLEDYKFKYAVSGFDSIECRLELLDTLKSMGNTRYLIDTRYDELAASVFLIDMEDEDQVNYYRRGLQSDLEAFEEERKKNIRMVETEEQWFQYINDNHIYDSGCAELHNKFERWWKELPSTIQETCPFNSITIDSCPSSCESTACIEHFKYIYRIFKDFIAKEIVLSDGNNRESSCVRQNFIDVYKFASTFIFSAIREIEAEETKPFTHIEVQTEKVPSYMILRK